MTELAFPKRGDLFWPILTALKTHGSASVGELQTYMALDMGLPDEILDIPHEGGGGGQRTKFGYETAWALTLLKKAGLIDNRTRGVWTITAEGRRIPSEGAVRDSVREAAKTGWGSPSRRAKEHEETPQEKAGKLGEWEDIAVVSETDEDSWREALLETVRGMEPAAFERLCQRVLREAGFVKVEVTGRSGDGGIDGAGVLRVQLISFHVLFQCKRYAGSVAPSEIRDFRGAMVGRADKGLMITTGRFTKAAEREAVRDGAPAIDLIDGNALCDLLKDLELGVRTVEVTSIRRGFFENI